MTRARIKEIAIGYVAACVVAVILSMAPFLPFLALLSFAPASLLAPFVIVAGVAAFALVPSLIAIAAAERWHIQSRWAHVAVGAAIGIVTILLFMLSEDMSRAPEQLFGNALLGSVPGMIGGLVYHGIAGNESVDAPARR